MNTITKIALFFTLASCAPQTFIHASFVNAFRNRFVRMYEQVRAPEASELGMIVSSGDCEKLKQLLCKGIDVDGIRVQKPDLKERTSLYRAAKKGQNKIVTRLMSAEADISRSKISGRSPLMRAIKSGYGKIVGQLINAGAEIETSDGKRNWGPLLYAASTNNDMAATQLLCAGADADKESMFGDTPLHLAAAENSNAVMGRLIAEGADVNRYQWFIDETPLQRACFLGHNEAVVRLLSAGADVHNAQKRTSSTALHMAVAGNHARTAEILLAMPIASDVPVAMPSESEEPLAAPMTVLLGLLSKQGETELEIGRAIMPCIGIDSAACDIRESRMLSVEKIRKMLRAKNYMRETPLALARRLNKDDSHQAVIAVLEEAEQLAYEQSRPEREEQRAKGPRIEDVD